MAGRAFLCNRKVTTVVGTGHDESGQGLRQFRSLRLSVNGCCSALVDAGT